MPGFSMSDPVTLFKGLDTEKWSVRPEACFYGRLDAAVRHAMEKLSSDEQHGAFIRLDKDHQEVTMDEIKTLYRSLGAN